MPHDHRLCGHCSGSGSVPLRADLQQTLNACRYLAPRVEDITAAKVHAALSDPPELVGVVLHRLKLLVALEYLERVVTCRRPARFRLAPTIATQLTPAEGLEGHAA
jgi:hypothetical protein